MLGHLGLVPMEPAIGESVMIDDQRWLPNAFLTEVPKPCQFAAPACPDRCELGLVLKISTTGQTSAAIEILDLRSVPCDRTLTT